MWHDDDNDNDDDDGDGDDEDDDDDDDKVTHAILWHYGMHLSMYSCMYVPSDFQSVQLGIERYKKEAEET